MSEGIDKLQALLDAGIEGDSACPDLIGPDGEPLCEPVVTELVRSFFAWEAGLGAASSAIERVAGGVVDLNEFRVCLDEELVELVGIDDPLALERVRRCKSALHSVFVNEHSVDLSRLPTLGKREAKAYLATIDGLPQYVSARVLVYAIGAHAVPVDGRIARALVAEGVVESGMPEDDIAAWLERQVRADRALEAAHALEHLAEKHAHASGVKGRDKAGSSAR